MTKLLINSFSRNQQLKDDPKYSVFIKSSKLVDLCLELEGELFRKHKEISSAYKEDVR